MATQQKPARSAPRPKSSSSGAKSRAGSSAAAKSKPKSKAAPRSSRPAPAPTPADRAAEIFAGHGRDVWGALLVIVGLVSAFGIYAGGAGTVGGALETAFGAAFGLLRFIVPPALVGAGVVLIAGSHSRSNDSSERAEVEVVSDVTTRRVVGGVLAVSSVAGLLHLAIDSPSLSINRIDAYFGAGGLLGAALGNGLGRLVGSAGASVVLLVMLVLAVTLLVGKPFRELAAIIVGAIRPLFGSAGDAVGGLFNVGEEAHEGGPEVRVFDYDADPDNPLSRKQRAPRAKKSAPAAQPKTNVLPEVTVPVSVEQLEMQLEPQRGDSPWRLPPLSLLSRSKAQQLDTAAITARGRELEGALAEHGVTTRLSGMVVGPTVTRYELELGVGVKVNQVVNLSKDIAYAMASPDVRIIAPIPGKQAIGVEVPNQKRQIIALGDILCSAEAQKSKGPLSVAVGRDIEGKAVMVDLAKMPHILIAGQTGAGKSSCINSIMTSVLMRATPDDVRLILVDPKRVELTQYNRVPHLLTQVVTNPKKAANALAWAVAEMERRYELLEEVGVRDIGGYNAAFDRGELTAQLGEDREFSRLPLILIVVDELADLMMVAARDVEESINRIAAKARAVGLHLVIATQRPSVNVITGVIKANIPARFAFSVASATDSKVIMNHGGAERLVGKGDMLFLDPAAPSAERIQGCFVEEKEVQSVVEIWRNQAPEVAYVEEVQKDTNLAAVALPVNGAGSGGAGGSGEEDDDLMWQAMELVVRGQFGSTSMLQRKLKVGFARAGRLMDLLEERGVVAASGGSKAREVLMSVEELEELLDQR